MKTKTRGLLTLLVLAAGFAGCQQNLIPIPSGLTDESLAGLDGTRVVASALTSDMSEGPIVIAGLSGASGGKGTVHLSVAEREVSMEVHTHDDGTFAAQIIVRPDETVRLEFSPEGQETRSLALELQVPVRGKGDPLGSPPSDGTSTGGESTGGTDGSEPDQAYGPLTPGELLGNEGLIMIWNADGTLNLAGAAGFVRPGHSVVAMNGTVSTSTEAQADDKGAVQLTLPASPGDALWILSRGDAGETSSMLVTEAPPPE